MKEEAATFGRNNKLFLRCNGQTLNERVRIEEKRFLLYADALFIRLMEHSLFIFSPRRFLSSHCYDDVFCPSILFCALVMKKTCCCTDDLCFLNPRRAKIAGDLRKAI